jgi:hypothetical protein
MHSKTSSCETHDESCYLRGSSASSSTQMTTVTAEMCETAFGESDIIKNKCCCLEI